MPIPGLESYAIKMVLEDDGVDALLSDTILCFIHDRRIVNAVLELIPEGWECDTHHNSRTQRVLRDIAFQFIWSSLLRGR